MQERSGIPDDPPEDRAETTLEGWVLPTQPEIGNKVRRDDSECTVDQSPAPPTADQLTAKNPAAVALGRLGGKKGGRARAARMTANERSEAARRAAIARWGAKEHK